MLWSLSGSASALLVPGAGLSPNEPAEECECCCSCGLEGAPVLGGGKLAKWVVRPWASAAIGYLLGGRGRAGREGSRKEDTVD